MREKLRKTKDKKIKDPQYNFKVESGLSVFCAGGLRPAWFWNQRLYLAVLR